MVKEIMKEIEKDPRFRKWTKGKKKLFLNHCVVLLYFSHNDLGQHADQVWKPNGAFADNENTQKQDTPTFLYTIGCTRHLRFYRKYAKRDGSAWDKTSPEKEPCMVLTMDDDTLAFIHPNDERPLCRNTKDGLEKKRLQFVHGVKKPSQQFLQSIDSNDMEYLSVCFAFREVEARTPVDIGTNTMIVCDLTVPNLDCQKKQAVLGKRKREEELAIENENSPEWKAARARWTCLQNFLKRYKEKLLSTTPKYDSDSTNNET